MKNTAIKLSGILLAGAVFFSTLLGYGTQVAAATAIGSDTEAGQALSLIHILHSDLAVAPGFLDLRRTRCADCIPGCDCSDCAE